MEVGLKARDLWLSGTDPNCVLDPGRLLDLEASLRRDQRRLPEALKLLEEAEPLSHRPGRILINKGFTLEVMGDSEQALEAFRQAEPLVERHGDRRHRYMLLYNEAVSFCHLGRFREAAVLVRQVQRLAAGDEIEMIRVTWRGGCIAAGLGRLAEAETLLEQAHHEFKNRTMVYDAALAGLELAVLLLQQGRAGEVKRLARELVEAFKANGVHREALAALQLFHEATEREAATAELARRILRFLFRARYDQDLRFNPA